MKTQLHFTGGRFRMACRASSRGLAMGAASSCTGRHQRLSQQTLLQYVGSCNASQFSTYQGAKLLLPECWQPTGLKSRLANKAHAVYRRAVTMSFLGVGAPEALLVAVVALVVFGPKGLAEAAKSLGRTLRAFQPTIREVVEVSQDIKGTLEKELGLDEIRAAAQPVPRARSSAPLTTGVPSSDGSLFQPITEEQALAVDPDIEAKRLAAAQAAWTGSLPSPAERPASLTPPSAQDLSALSVDALEAELARRKSASHKPADGGA